MFNFFTSSGFIPTITRPTRITHTSCTLIDNIYTNITSDATIHSGILTYDISDHLPILTSIGHDKTCKAQPLKIQYRPIDDKAYFNISEHLENTEWTYLTNLQTNEVWESFQSKITEAIELFAPIKTVKIPAKHIIRQPWMTSGILKSSHTLDKLYRKSIGRQKQDQKHIYYIKYRNTYNRIKRITKRTYYLDLFKKYKNDIRNTWKILKSIIGRENDKTSISEQFKCENIVTTNPQIISNEFCKYFSSVGNTFASAIPPPMQKFNYYLPNQKSMTQSIYFSPTDPTEILRTINSLKAKQNTGPDNSSSYLIKQIKSPLSSPVSLLINKSIEDGVVSDVFKTAKVIPIYKSKNK